MLDNFENDFLTVSFAESDDGSKNCYVKYGEDVDPNAHALNLDELGKLCSKFFGSPCSCDFVDVGENGEEVYTVAMSTNEEKRSSDGVRFIENNGIVTWPKEQEYDKGEPCCMCGKTTKFATKYAVCIGGGARTIIHGEDTTLAEEVDNGFMGYYAVGPECRKKLPKEYTKRFKVIFPNG